MRPTRKNFLYYTLALICALFLFLLISWLPAFTFWLTLLEGSSSLAESIQTTSILFARALLDSSPLLTAFNGVVALLVGTNIALLAYYWRHYRTQPSKKSAATGLLGTLITFLGFGCASCGTLFITYLLTGVGATSLATLPIINSYAIQAIGIVLLMYSTFELYKKTMDPLVCY